MTRDHRYSGRTLKEIGTYFKIGESAASQTSRRFYLMLVANVSDIIISSIFLNGTIHAETRPYCIEDYDNAGIPDLKVKFKRSDVINLLPNGDNVQVLVTGTVGTITFEGVDTIRVIK